MKIFDEKGITLVELLATFTILLIVLPVIYGVFSSGLQLYNKIQIEGQLRDDADYAVTMIMNSFYSYPFDEVRSCGDNCLELVNNTATKLEKVPDQSFYQIKENQSLDTNATSMKIKLVDSQDGQELEIDGKKLDINTSFQRSALSYTCKQSQNGSCAAGKDGMIHISLRLKNDRLDKTFELTSQFGF